MRLWIEATASRTVLALALGLCACADGAGGTQPEPPPPVFIPVQDLLPQAVAAPDSGQDTSAPAWPPPAAGTARDAGTMTGSTMASDTSAPLKGGGVSAPDAGCPLLPGARSLEEAKGDPKELPAACVPAWTQAQLIAGFAAIRDTRWLEWDQLPGFARRLPWLSAANGCEERALAAKYFLAEAGYPSPWFARAKKREGVLGFSARTDNEPGGVVKWSAHVAPVVRVEGKLLVLDPALDAARPLPLLDWLELFSTPQNRDVALCRDRERDAGCMDLVPRELRNPGDLQLRLSEEWFVQELLGRDPYRVLDTCPPWTSCAEPEPKADPRRAPVVYRFATDQYSAALFYPLYIVGDNFIPALTRVRIVGVGLDEYAEIESLNMRSILLSSSYLDTRGFTPGRYWVYVENGEFVSEGLALDLPL
ncbi:MAG TPA: protein-glutamine glutaminase family protein [Polyangiales bacterium]